MFMKYKKFKDAIQINSDPNKKWCPRPDCEQFVVGKNQTFKISCNCGYEFCFNCGNPWHEGKSCDEIIDEDLEKYIKTKSIIKCPRCNTNTEKNLGCDHMTCSECLH